MKPLKSNRVQDWTKKDIQTWLSLNGLPEYYIDFVECGITDGSLLKNKIDGISSEQDLQNWVSNFVFAFGHLRKLYSAINHLKDNAFVFNIESVNFENERQKNDKLSGKSSSFVSKATAIDSGMIRNRDVRTLTVHEVVSLIRNDSRIIKLKDENLGIAAWSKEHEETFLSHKIDGQIFINITKPSDYANYVFDKLRPAYSDGLRAELFETLTRISQDIYGNGYRYVDPIDRSSTIISDVISQSGQSSDSSYPLLTHQEQLGVIIGKIRQSSKKVQNMSDDDLKEYAENLCTIEGLKKAYLNKEFNAIKKLFSSMRNISQQSKGFSLNSKSESKSLIGMTDSASLDKLPSDIDEAEELSKKLPTRFRDTIKVKLVIAEIAKNKKERTMRRLLSPIMSSVSMSPQFGLFHSGVIIGPWLIEWNSSSLCIPRRCYSNAATLAIDIQEISTKNLDVAIENVSQVISEWNVHRAYSQHSSNCQHFVDDICKALGIKMNFSGSMQHYVEKLRTKGLCNIRWRVPDDIRELVGVKEKKITFYTHKQLDILVCTILSKIPDFQEKYEEDYMLLKSFDRAFWLRSFKSPQNANYHAITPEENRKYSGLKSEDDDDMGVFGGDDDEGDGSGDGTGCPFGHPEYRSFTSDWW